MKISLWSFIFITLFSGLAYCSEWTLHTAMNDINDIEYDGDVFWLGTTGGVLRWDMENGSMSTFTASDFGKDIGFHGVLAVKNGHNGKKWFGGDGWIMEYDGVSWSVYECPGIVNELAVDNDGNVWIASSANAFRFKDGILYSCLSDENPRINASCVAVDENTVWFGGQLNGGGRLGLYHYDKESWTFFGTLNSGLPWRSIYSIGFDPNGLLWIGASGGICTYDGETWNKVAYGDIKFSGIRDFKFKDNGIVLAASCRGLLAFDGSDWITYNAENSGLPESIIRSIEIDDHGVVWVSSGDQGAIRTPKNGLTCFDGKVWRNEKFPGLQGNGIRAVAVDRNDVVWVSTKNEVGISFFKDGKWNNISKDEFIASRYVYDIAVDNNNTVWFGYYNGTSSYDGESWKLYTDIDGLTDATINTLAVDRDNVKWFGTGYDIISFDGENWTVHEMPDGSQDLRIVDMAVDVNNVKWFASSMKGVFSFDGENWRHYTVENGLEKNEVKAVAVDQDNVKWFSIFEWNVEGGGISSFDGENWIKYGSDDGVSPGYMRVDAIIVDNNNVKWFGNGLTLDGTEWKIDHDVIISPRFVNNAANDSHGGIWFATERGALHFTGYENPAAVDIAIPKNDSFFITGLYPNPFNYKTTINIYSHHELHAGIKIYNLLGQTVRNFGKINLMSGANTVTWNCKDDSGQIVSSGIYFFQIEDGKYSAIAKMMFVQ